MSRKTAFAVATILSLVCASAAMAQGTTKKDSTHKKVASTAMKSGKTSKTSGMKKATAKGTKMAKSKGSKKGSMKKDSTSKKP
jgi:pentapeptide MXKDX repeat protein